MTATDVQERLPAHTESQLPEIITTFAVKVTVQQARILDRRENSLVTVHHPVSVRNPPGRGEAVPCRITMVVWTCVGHPSIAHHAVPVHGSTKFTSYTAEFFRKAGLDHLDSSPFTRPKTPQE